MIGPVRRTLGILAAGCALAASTAAAGEFSAPTGKGAIRPRILQAQNVTDQTQMPPEPYYVRPPQSQNPASATTDNSETRRPIKCPPLGPLTLRPVPAGDGYGKMICHLSFTGDCYGENWRLQNWRNPLWNMPKHTSKFHLKTHNHALWSERFWLGICGKLPNGYVHDTSGWALKSFATPQPNDPTIPYVQEATAVVYDYPQYYYQPSSCLPIGACPAAPGVITTTPAPSSSTPSNPAPSAPPELSPPQ